jgi:hypothetical protein
VEPHTTKSSPHLDVIPNRRAAAVRKLGVPHFSRVPHFSLPLREVGHTLRLTAQPLDVIPNRRVAAVRNLPLPIPDFHKMHCDECPIHPQPAFAMITEADSPQDSVVRIKIVCLQDFDT